MNIKDAKEQIKNAMTAYFSKDGFGGYRIPIEKQRPVFLIGPPGIGKTAIMEQVASEIGVGLVTYSMTHHTRQSALGLPFIIKREFEGLEYEVSEYTMSEIIGSVYKLMEETGVREGILFLDEINCVSETLAPCMLQFLQYKIFGQHQIPNGWIVVTAGNPPEYNKSVRDFDIVTWDRLKRIDVEPDYEAWKEYAYQKGVHASVTTYLAARKKDFYLIESTADGKSFVTARGWDDLSEMIRLYEENGIRVDEKLVGQYIQNRRIAKDFSIYYDLYNKYSSDYQVESVLAGNASDSIILRAQMAKFDERLSLLGLLFDAVTADLRGVAETEDTLTALKTELREFALELEKTDLTTEALIKEHILKLQSALDKGAKASTMSLIKQRTVRHVIATLEDSRANILKSGASNDAEAFQKVKTNYETIVSGLTQTAAEAKQKLENLFAFYEAVGDCSNDLLLLVTELTANYFSSRFIGHYGCEKYFKHNDELKFCERQKDITSRLEELDWKA